jgi:hypothetical protein
MQMREIMDLVETIKPPDVFPVPPVPDDFDAHAIRTAYLGAILANEMVGRDRSWNRRTGLRKAIAIVDDVGGMGGYTNEAWLACAREYIETGTLPRRF